MNSSSPSVAVSYTMLYNTLDFPAGVVPVTMVTDEDDEELKGYQGYFQDWWDRTLAKVSGARFLRSASIPILSPGLPPTLSLSCLSYRLFVAVWGCPCLCSAWPCRGRKSCASG